jgi:predicted lipoprotein with Yx(FWY)xxD motif
MTADGKPSRDRGVLLDMRFTALLALLAVSAVLAACGSSYGGSDANRSGSGSMSGAKSDVVASATKAKVGSVIVDAQGRTLYRFTAEAQGRPVCTGACVATWPPAIVTDAAGLLAHVATVRRPDGGELQLTYEGHPLYRYAGDRSKADANGEGVGGQWFVLKAGGGDGSSASKSQPAKPAGSSSYGY